MSDEQRPPAPPAPDELQAKYEEATAGWKRALADYDNLKKDLAKERADMTRHVQWRAAQSFLPVLDNFDQAVKFTPAGLDQQAQNWLAGILFIRVQLERALAELGCEPFGAAGDPFDPNLHEAVSQRKEEGTEPGVVLDVARRGWKMGDTVVRPAGVIVSE